MIISFPNSARFFHKKTIFYLSLSNARKASKLGRDFLNIFLNSISSLSFSNIHFNICVNLNKPAFPSFNFRIFNEGDGTSLNNDDRKEF